MNYCPTAVKLPCVSAVDVEKAYFKQIKFSIVGISKRLKTDNKHRFFLIFRKVLRNGYFLKYFALELITPILMCVFIMDKKQSMGFNQF